MSTPAGWYTQGDGTQRYWSGTEWTEHHAPPVSGPSFRLACTLAA